MRRRTAATERTEQKNVAGPERAPATCEKRERLVDRAKLPARLATVAAAAAAEPAPAAPASASAELRLRAGFVNGESASAELRAVQLRDRLLGVGIRGHLDEREAARAARRVVPNHADRVHTTSPAEEFAKLVLVRRIRKIAYVQFATHLLRSLRADPHESTATTGRVPGVIPRRSARSRGSGARLRGRTSASH